ncbi:DUF6933 domain-containing protein [Pseudomonas sp. RA_15y_Pfl2_54]|uniref:DUF6933 domain-containing protein n=1 Tax=Pseudomonas sp. RA_15y_Pfl2_54 TaxID=3088704 RepID=UPI0030DCB3D9
MLIFNCTEAASKFFSRIQKGKTLSPVDPKPPSSIIEDDPLTGADEQWLVHAITVQRKHVLIAIHVKTRYCMIFADAKKADAEGFVARFVERWASGLLMHALKHDLQQWLDPDLILARMTQTCEQQTFYRRSHRSAQKHIDEIAWIFQSKAAQIGCLPPDEDTARVFDEQMNDTPRNSKGVKTYYFPDEEMTLHWLRHYCFLDDVQLHAAKARRKQIILENAAIKREAWLQEYERQHSNT